jgi:ribonuclease-3
MDNRKIENWLGVEFRNKNLLIQALTHRSWANENRFEECRNNERLEFLGDAVLEIVATDFLFHTFPEMSEGQMTLVRSKLVCAESLATVGEGGDLFDHLRMSKGERSADNRGSRTRIVASAMEAIMGAIWLDQGIGPVTAFVTQKLLTHVRELAHNSADPKSVLQERAQECLKITPSYRVIEESGPDHAKRFVIGTYFGESLIAKGHGPSKKGAEFKAAEAALILKGWSASPMK